MNGVSDMEVAAGAGNNGDDGGGGSNGEGEQGGPMVGPPEPATIRGVSDMAATEGARELA
ncbi:hypothetical protein CVT25_005200 [Psilocybe cyanescens]|uniref:Uncharacterized protein n=1 Tax=Psilocybe cyanescens TaxID=93625 RepID=A0A409XMK9_PSICY|nr:hypothetical protein CVT25_005200 [Psilocybe cyanescens]